MVEASQTARCEDMSTSHDDEGLALCIHSLIWLYGPGWYTAQACVDILGMAYQLSVDRLRMACQKSEAI